MSVSDAEKELCKKYYRGSKPAIVPLLPNSVELVLQSIVGFSEVEIKNICRTLCLMKDNQVISLQTSANTKNEDEFAAELGLSSSEKTKALRALLNTSGWVDLAQVLPLS
jgi:hypothetical protein